MALESNPTHESVRVVAEVRGTLVKAAESEHLPPELLIALVQLFTAAKLDLGDDLRASIGVVSDRMASQAARIEPEDIGRQYAAVADAFGCDPFVIHEQLSERLAAFPDLQRSKIIGSFVASEVPSMRDAALGWLLDASPFVVKQAAKKIAEAAKHGALSAESAERVVLMRPWLDESVQSILDGAARTCRQRGLQPKAKLTVQIGSVIVSGSDGAGA